MDAIEWNDSYSVGVAELDEQHKKLLRIINTMFESDDLSVNSQTITDLLTEMVEYASAHFDVEEKFMTECEYPDLANHIRTHEIFRKKVDKLRSARMAENKDMPSDMIRFLYEWLVNHIIFCDKKYVPYLASHDSDNSCEKETTTALNNFNQEQ